MKREQYRGGLKALLGEAPEPERKRNIEEDVTPPSKIESAPAIQGTPQEEEELLDSIEDEELKAALRARRNLRRGRPRKDAEARQRDSEIYTRTCWVMRKEYAAKLKEISFQESLTIREIMEQIVGDAIEAYERKHGELHPTNHKGDASKLFK